MSFIETVKAKAKSLPQTIVLPESQEPRNLEAAEKVLREGIAKIILLGKREEIMKAAQGRDLAGATFIDPLTDPKRGEYIETLVELRKAKGMTAEKAAAAKNEAMDFGMVRNRSMFFLPVSGKMKNNATPMTTNARKWFLP